MRLKRTWKELQMPPLAPPRSLRVWQTLTRPSAREPKGQDSMTSCQRTLRWSVTTCRKARDVAIATKPTLLRARVEGHTTRAVAEAGASCVRL